MTKNEYIKFKRCPKAYILEKLKPELKKDPGENVLNNYKLAEDSFLEQFKDIKKVENTEDPKKMYEDTLSLLKTSKYIANATFVVDDAIMIIDVLEIINKNTVDIHIVSSKSKINYTHKLEVSYYKALFSLLKINVNNVYIYTINSKYKRKNNLEICELFNKEKVMPLLDIRQVLLDLNEAKKYKSLKDVSSVKIDECCNKPYFAEKTENCPYMSHCISALGKNNIFEISGSSVHFDKKLKWYKKGIVTFEDLIKSEEDYSNAKLQIETEFFNLPPFIDKKSIEMFLDKLSYPLYFLDFETYCVTVPFSDGVNPYEQVSSQYSLHIQKEKAGALEHRAYLAKEGTNTKREIAEQLIKDIPENACVLAYNMSFEKTQIKKMAEDFPDLEEHLMNIYNNIQDLMVPFKNKYYYQKEFNGLYTIKAVLPALYPNDTALNYKKLSGIHNGGEAMVAFATLHEKSKKEIKEIRQQLLNYCCLDTLAMVKVLDKLYEFIK